MVNIKGEIDKGHINFLVKKILNKAIFNGTYDEFEQIIEITNNLYDIAKGEIYKDISASMTNSPKQISILAERELTDRIKRS